MGERLAVLDDDGRSVAVVALTALADTFPGERDRSRPRAATAAP